MSQILDELDLLLTKLIVNSIRHARKFRLTHNGSLKEQTGEFVNGLRREFLNLNKLSPNGIPFEIYSAFTNTNSWIDVAIPRNRSRSIWHFSYDFKKISYEMSYSIIFNICQSAMNIATKNVNEEFLEISKALDSLSRQQNVLENYIHSAKVLNDEASVVVSKLCVISETLEEKV